MNPKRLVESELFWKTKRIIFGSGEGERDFSGENFPRGVGNFPRGTFLGGGSFSGGNFRKGIFPRATYI